MIVYFLTYSLHIGARAISYACRSGNGFSNGTATPAASRTVLSTATITSSFTPTTSTMPSHTPSQTSTVTPSNTREIFPKGESNIIEKTFKSSTTWQIPERVSFVDVFLVGGGGGAGWRGGGGGGYTRTFAVDVRRSKAAHITIGQGGQRSASSSGQDGQSTMFRIEPEGSTVTAEGGKGGDDCCDGGSGGSGGGAGSSDSGCGNHRGGNGGSNGGNGANNFRNNNGGRGQGSTTKAFGFSDGKLFGGGGAGGACDPSCMRGSGGTGGGASSGRSANANTGGGGGAGGGDRGSSNGCGRGGNGGSGIIMIRYKLTEPIQPSSTPRAIACTSYDSNTKTYYLTCSFNWTEAIYSTTDFIALQRNEIFDGNNHEINLSGVNEWNGLFRIDDSAEFGPTSLEDAPIIRRVHLIGGRVTFGGGFLVQQGQKHFIVDSCTSSGKIDGTYGPNQGGGGICGQRCSGDILIARSQSSGSIGFASGGIMGSQAGTTNMGRVNISECHSTGLIHGSRSGGICGEGTGSYNGHVTIFRSYSTGSIYGSQSGGLCGYEAGSFNGNLEILYSSSAGNVIGPQSGGLCGGRVAYSNGDVEISQSYSLGDITGINSGGLVGRDAGSNSGRLRISNCYTRGEIKGQQWSGGICGFKTGVDEGYVVIDSVYASGTVKSTSAGGIIGHVAKTAELIEIRNCVYNRGPIVRSDEARRVESRNNSNDLSDIIGKVYCPFMLNDEACWDTNRIWSIVTAQLPQLQIEVAPSATPSMTPSPTMTSTSSSTSTMTPTSTPSSSSRPKRVNNQQCLIVQRPRRYVK